MHSSSEKKMTTTKAPLAAQFDSHCDKYTVLESLRFSAAPGVPLLSVESAKYK